MYSPAVSWCVGSRAKRWGSSVHLQQTNSCAFDGTDFRDVQVEVADRLARELFSLGFVAADLRQAADTMKLEVAVQRRSGQVRDCRLQGIEAVVQWQKGMAAEGDTYGLVFDA